MGPFDSVLYGNEISWRFYPIALALEMGSRFYFSYKHMPSSDLDARFLFVGLSLFKKCYCHETEMYTSRVQFMYICILQIKFK